MMSIAIRVGLGYEHYLMFDLFCLLNDMPMGLGTYLVKLGLG